MNRDELAKEFALAFIKSGESKEWSVEVTAKVAYQMADALIAESKK